MTQPKRRPSLGDIKRQRDRADFVGRDQQIEHFRQNLALRLDDGRRRFIYGISGQGGVGKTTLLRQYRRLLEQNKAAIAYIDEAITEVPAALAAFSAQLADQGHKLSRFDERYRTYRQRRQELEADPDRPSETTAFVGTIIGKVGVKLARRVPIGGAFFDLVDEDQFALQVGQFIREAIQDLTDLLVVFPDHTAAQQAKALLETALQ